MVPLALIIPAVAALFRSAFAQTSTSCNPLDSTCPIDPALGKAVFYDFTKGPSSDFSLSTGSFPTFNSSGAEFTIAQHLDSPTLTSNWYIMFGHYDIVLRSSPGQGVISSIVLLSDDLDEIDLEFLGAQDNNVQTNYFGKGNTQTYDREITVSVTKPQETVHTYSIDWTADAITWAIDGQVLRTLTPQNADTNQYPQTPMRLKIGTWPSGDPAEAPGVTEWGGGPINYNDGPFTMTVLNLKVIDYSSGTSYSYGNHSGTWQSIKSNGGKINSNGNPNTPASTVAMEGFSTSTPVPTPSHSSAPATVVHPIQSTTGQPLGGFGNVGVSTIAVASAPSPSGQRNSGTNPSTPTLSPVHSSSPLPAHTQARSPATASAASGSMPSSSSPASNQPSTPPSPGQAGGGSNHGGTSSVAHSAPSSSGQLTSLAGASKPASSLASISNPLSTNTHTGAQSTTSSALITGPSSSSSATQEASSLPAPKQSGGAGKVGANSMIHTATSSPGQYQGSTRASTATSRSALSASVSTRSTPASSQTISSAASVTTSLNSFAATSKPSLSSSSSKAETTVSVSAQLGSSHVSLSSGSASIYHASPSSVTPTPSVVNPPQSGVGSATPASNLDLSSGLPPPSIHSQVPIASLPVSSPSGPSAVTSKPSAGFKTMARSSTSVPTVSVSSASSSSSPSPSKSSSSGSNSGAGPGSKAGSNSVSSAPSKASASLPFQIPAPVQSEMAQVENTNPQLKQYFASIMSWFQKVAQIENTNPQGKQYLASMMNWIEQIVQSLRG